MKKRTFNFETYKWEKIGGNIPWSELFQLGAKKAVKGGFKALGEKAGRTIINKALSTPKMSNEGEKIAKALYESHQKKSKEIQLENLLG